MFPLNLNPFNETYQAFAVRNSRGTPNLLTPALGDAAALSASPPTDEERAALDQLAAFHATGTGYFIEQATRPQTIGYAMLDSPVALTAWMIDHDTDSYQKIARAFVEGQPSGNLTRDHIVDNITLYC